MFVKIKVIIPILAIMLASFTSPYKDTTKSVKITKSSVPIEASEFLLREGITMLASTDDYLFYVTVKSKNVKGKKELSNHRKIKRKGQQYNVTYTYEYRSSKLKKTYDLYYIVWEDGEVFEVKPTIDIYVENIRLLTEV
ncbi:hypothetical protein GCM10011344_47950 [Dokdonia pacifica]|uniref:Uncharacterized protein n=1 Tax=Dokdonia pacifica TaxID=1627892 RepID=A0A239DWL6_9FLAO|nr:hypothetical protein [Dokdonia pacifica]GGG41417.1 hypothetical protein GCM10011344_47950 [Dokdonia pacifica]SNS36860.1 hypothetical protein SAMN06265376_112100 [Dokdonia pacifica]